MPAGELAIIITSVQPPPAMSQYTGSGAPAPAPSGSMVYAPLGEAGAAARIARQLGSATQAPAATPGLDR